MIGKLVTLLEDQIRGKVRFVSIGVEDEGNAKLRYTYTSNQSKFYPESREIISKEKDLKLGLFLRIHG